MSMSIDSILATAVSLHQRNNLPEAARLYRQILDVEPSQPDALHLLGVVEHQSRRHEEAVRLIGAAIGQRKDIPLFHNNLGEALNALGRADEAMAAYQRAIALDPGYLDARNNLGVLFRKQGRPADAEACYRQVLASVPGHPGTLNNLGGLLNQTGRQEEAVECFRKAIAAQPRMAEAHFNLGNALVAKGRRGEGVRHLAEAAAIRPGFVQAHQMLGRALSDLGYFTEAEQAFSQVVKLAPDQVDARIHLGLVLASQGKLDAALDCAQAAFALMGSVDDARYALGVLYAKCGRPDEARAAFEASLRHDPEDASGARLALARLGCVAIPAQPPIAMLREIYRQRAKSWNRSSDDVGAYAAPALVAEGLARLGTEPDRGAWRVLDAGCGTGLVGQLVRAEVGRLEGVDLSEAMLEHARQCAHYDELHAGDMVAFMSGKAAAYDAIVSAATLIHFGDLQPVFAAAARALREAGVFVFTLFPLEDGQGDVAVGDFNGHAQGAIFRHGRSYIRRIAADGGFLVEILEDRVHERAQGEQSMGLLVGLRRGAKE